MAPSPGLLYLCLVGIATGAALVCVVFAGEVRLDACLWLAIAFVASVLYFFARSAQLPLAHVLDVHVVVEPVHRTLAPVA